MQKQVEHSEIPIYRGGDKSPNYKSKTPPIYQFIERIILESMGLYYEDFDTGTVATEQF